MSSREEGEKNYQVETSFEQYSRVESLHTALPNPFAEIVVADRGMHSVVHRAYYYNTDTVGLNT